MELSFGGKPLNTMLAYHPNPGHRWGAVEVGDQD